MAQPPVVVTAMKAQWADWKPGFTAVGSIKAYRGVDVTTEVGGIVRSVGFKSGQDVEQGALLVQLNADSDVAQLHALEAAAALSDVVLERDRAQLKENAVSQAQVDADEADWKSKHAAAEQQKALVAKKSIVAPFSGQIGITNVNPGQYLNPGDKVATLATLDPIYVDFNVPQSQKPLLSLGQSVVVNSDALPDQTFAGKVTALDSKIDPTTRNILVEATLSNPHRKLLPGMFARAQVTTGGLQKYLTVPQTSVTFNPYGTTVFIAESSKDDQGNEILVAKQVFIDAGPSRGDQLAVVNGIKAGDLVITSGQMKLKNGTVIRVNNSNEPANDAAPTPQEK
jgi:membrane fusion protein (multidrug efflux system)